MVESVVDLAAIETLDFAKGGGFLPAVVQHAEDDRVLMVGYMNREALRATLTRRRVVFFSRSKCRLWEKGETSGNFLELDSLRADCDRDALLVRARPRGPVCHLERASCFGDDESRTATGTRAAVSPLSFLETLERIVAERVATRPAGSYTATLVLAGKARIAQKLGEEGLEVALAAVAGTDEAVIDEAADLLYHLLVLLEARGLKLARVLEELEVRHRSALRSVCAVSHDPDGHF